MKFNFQHLRNYVAHDESVESLCQIFNRIGLEVEEVVTPSASLSGLVIGEVVRKDPHPNADRLTLCQVEIGTGIPQQIVCGATNHSVGSKVVVALPGQILPGDLEIVEREIRGVPSAGMMCSMRELGLGEDHEGIILLPEEARVGSSPIGYLTQIDLSVTPNRPDCLGWIGIAREVALATGRDLVVPESPLPQAGHETLSILLEDPAGCPRYLGKIVRGVKVGPSPAWLQDALVGIGLKPINNVVDVTNFVLMERGQPLHAFDLNRLSGPEIRVRKANQGESFVSLTGVVCTLSSDDLVIADNQHPVALAGVMGGGNSEVSEQTTDLLIECAFFNPSRIRRTARAQGFATDSSFRFERGVDPYGLEAVIDRCVSLILLVAGGEVASGTIEAKSPMHLPEPLCLSLRTAKASEKVGTHIAENHQTEILRKLGCSLREKNPEVLQVTVPTFRPDLVREIDLIEELARHFGYDNIPSTPPELPNDAGVWLPVLSLDKKVRHFLIGQGWLETKSFSFNPADYPERMRLASDHPLRHSVRIRNPIGSDMAQLRTTLAVSLLETLQRNYHRGEKSLRVFESGKVYLRDFNDLLDCERETIGLAWFGTAPKHWSEKERNYDFYDAKGTVEALWAELGLRNFAFSPYHCDFYHPGQSGEWKVADQPIGAVGKLHPSVTASFDLPSDPVLVEIDLTVLSGLLETQRLRLEVPSPFPPIRRDLSLTVPLETSCEDLLDLIRESRTPFLESIEIFDRYVGAQVGEGNQSLGFRLSYRSQEKTLTEEEISPIHHGLLMKLNETLGAIQRGMSMEVQPGD